MTYPTLLDLCRLEANKASPLSTADKETLTHWINQGLAELWTAEPYKIWPWSAAFGSQTLTSYRFTHTSISFSRLFTVWEADPRPLWAAGTYPQAKAYEATVDTSNVLVQSAGATDTVYVVYLKALPEFNYVTDAASVADTIPTQASRYLLAYVARRNVEQNLTSQSEQLLERAYNRERLEMNRLVELATPDWNASPWLDWVETYKKPRRSRDY